MARHPPVSRALQWHTSAAVRAALAPAINAINRTHRDGVLPRIPVIEYVPRNEDDDLMGKYSYDRVDGTPFALLVRHDAYAALTFLHEIGHFLDAEGIGAPHQFASESDERLGAWREAVRHSAQWEWYERLVRGQLVPYTLPSGVVIERRIPLDDLAYVTRYREFFARSYAQYIAVESGNRVLIAQLDMWRDRQTWILQWSDDDFLPVRAALAHLMIASGWRSP